MAAEICMDNGGIPLSLDVAFGVEGPASLRAIDELPNSLMDDISELPWKGGPSTVAISELRLPPIPSLDDYLKTAEVGAAN